MQTTIKDLAAQMGVSESDVIGFVECLSVWVSKGYTFEQAIEKHMAQMMRLAENACAIAANGQAFAVEAFFPEAA